MVYTSLTIGSYTFTNVQMLSPQFLAAVQAGKLLGSNKAALFTWGAHGVTPIMFRGLLVGASGKTDLWTIIGELETKTVKRLKADFLNGVDIFGYIQNVTPTEQAAWTRDGTYNFPVQVTFMAGMRSNQGDRGISYGVQEEADTFSFTGRPVVPLPIGASSASETTGISRLTDDGAGGALTVPCVESPTQTRIIYTVATEADLEKSLVEITRLGDPVKGYQLSNKSIKLKTRHAETTDKGRIDYHYYDGSTWITGASLRGYVANSGATVREFTASTNPPETWVLFSGDPERQALRLKYPATTISGYEATMEMEVQRGTPYFKWTIENAGTTDLTKAVYYCAPVAKLAYVNASGTEYSAASGTQTIVGDTDPNNVFWLQSTSGATASGGEVFGFARKKKADCDHTFETSGTSTFDDVYETFDNVTVKRGYTFEPVWFFGGTYVPMGSIQPSGIGLEVLSRVTVHQGIIPRT